MRKNFTGELIPSYRMTDTYGDECTRMSPESKNLNKIHYANVCTNIKLNAYAKQFAFMEAFLFAFHFKFLLFLSPSRCTINETSNVKCGSIMGTQKICAADADEAEHDFQRGRRTRQLGSRVQR